MKMDKFVQMLRSLGEEELSINLQNCEMRVANLQLWVNGVLTVMTSAEEARDLELNGQITVRNPDKQLVGLSIVDKSIVVDIKSLAITKLLAGLGKGRGKKKNEFFEILKALQRRGYPITVKYRGITVVKDISKILKWLSGHAEQ